MTRLWLLISLSVCTATSGPRVLAQDEQYLPAKDVRSTADRILADPEFRYFEHFSPDGQLRGRKAGTGSEPSRPTFGQPGQGESSNDSGKASSRGNGAAKEGGSRPSRSQEPPQQPGEAEQAAPAKPADAGPAPTTPRPTRDRTRARPKADTDGSGPRFEVPDIGLGGIGSALGYLLQGLAYLAVAVAIGLIVYLVVQAIASWERRKRSATEVATGNVSLFADDRSPGETPADEFVRQALELAAAGQFREAIAQLLLGGMSHIERGRLIRYRRGLTFRDYLRVLRGSPSAFTGFRAMVDQYEPVNFGRREATQQSFDAAFAGYQSGFSREAQP